MNNNAACQIWPLEIKRTDAMSRKKFIMIGMVIGSIAGGYAPMLLGADSFSASLIGSIIGGLLCIWGAYKLYG